MPLTPARIVAAADGTPRSADYGDVYHSADGGVGQSRHVFVGGNDLPARWRGRASFTIVEAGFGLGFNFVVTWQTWRDDPRRCERLHYVGIDAHPPAAADLARFVGRVAALAPLVEQLCADWPEPVPGFHRRHFEDSRLALTLAFGDVADVLPQLRLTADAFYLDGFAPDRNPRMWSPEVLARCARLAAPGATVATYTAARAVRDRLAAAGFAVERRPGFAAKRHMLAGTVAARAPGNSAAAPRRRDGPRAALVIGCGLAGAAAAERIAARGHAVTIVDAAAGPVAGASGLHVGAVHPHLSRDDAVLSRLVRAGFLYSRSVWRALERDGYDTGWHPCGVALPARTAVEEATIAAIVAAHRFPDGFAAVADRDALRARCGVALGRGGAWFAGAGIVEPKRLVAAQLARAAATLRFGRHVERLHCDGGEWHALDADGRTIASAPVVVLANAADATRLAAVGAELRQVRGQVTHVPAAIVAGVQAAVVGPGGGVLPAVGGTAVVGGSYDRADTDTAARVGEHRRALAILERLLPGCGATALAERAEGVVGLRAVSADRLPLVGALPDVAAALANPREVRERPLADFPRVPGLYGAFGFASRGLSWAALAGEIVASQIDGEPAPVEGRLLDAIDPARFLLKRMRRERLGVPGNETGSPA